MATGVKQQQRRGTAVEWNTANHVLDEGELGVTTDTGIIKIGDGVNGWNDLPVAFGSEYLPLLGKAVDSELLDGIDSSGYFKTADATTAATADKLAKRDATGKLKAATGTTADDVVNFDQMVAADVVSKQILISRTVTAAFTLALTDVGKTILVDNSSYTTFACNIPLNASVAFPVGSVVTVITTNKGPTTLTPAGGVNFTGPTALPGGVSSVVLVKIAEDWWLVHDIKYSAPPVLRRKIKEGSDNTLTSGIFQRMRLDGADVSGYGNNFDTLGTNEQYDSSTDLYRAFVRRAGIYFVKAQVSLEQATASRFFIQLRINNTEYDLGLGFHLGGASECGSMFSTEIPLAVGDYVEVWTYYDGGGTRTVVDSPYASSIFEWCWQRPL